MLALVLPARALVVPCVQHCGLLRRRSGESSDSAGWWRRPLTRVGAFPRYRQVCMYTGTALGGLNGPSLGYTTKTLSSEQQSNWGLNLAAAACITDEKKNTVVPKKPFPFQFPSHRPSITNKPADIRVVYFILFVFRLSCIVNVFLHMKSIYFHTLELIWCRPSTAVFWGGGIKA